MKNPIAEWTEESPKSNWDAGQGDRRLDFDFDEKDFTGLQNFLDIKLHETKQREDESYEEHEQRLKNQYLKLAAEKGYELLGRIWYWYESVGYLPSEINRLHKECLKFKEHSRNENQLTAAGKLISASNEALKASSGIFLASD
ncbi:MAG TPA: hypothetical protein VGB00_00125 [Pyrinomonadaceae bacterium]